MNIIIVGCGKIGMSLVERLSHENHDLVLVDLNPDKIEDATNRFDALGVVGNGASFEIQQEAGIEKADIFIAVTGSDELNLLCCLIAKKNTKIKTIARVRNPMYNREIQYIRKQLGLSMIINPELTAAREIAKLLQFPAAIKIDTFARGRIELLRFWVKPEMGFEGRTIMDITGALKSDILICAAERGTEVFIPDGSFVVHDGDILSVVGSAEAATDFFRKVGIHSRQVNNSLIVGGGTIALYLAQSLIRTGFRVRIIEQDMHRCEFLSETIPEADIVHGDGGNLDLLMHEGLTNADSIVFLTNMDEENIFLSLYARRHSNAKLVSKVNRLPISNVIEEMEGIDIGSIIYPNSLSADYILQYVRGLQNSIGSNVETLYKILDEKAEALEFYIKEPSAVTDVPIMDLDLKPNLLICCINRAGKILTPKGQTQIKVGDSVVIVTTNEGLNDICDILKS